MKAHYLNAGRLPDPMGRYPTPDEIMARPSPLFRLGAFLVIKNWKTNFYAKWAARNVEEKAMYIQELADVICGVYDFPSPVVSLGVVTRYLPGENEIILEHPSILSMLHELGHHLFGPSEYHACRFSVWLYQNCFASDNEKLVWQGHMRVKPSSLQNVEP